MQGSRQFKDFEDYLVPPEKFASLKQSSALLLAMASDQYLSECLELLEAQLATVNRMAAANVRKTVVFETPSPPWPVSFSEDDCTN